MILGASLFLSPLRHSCTCTIQIDYLVNRRTTLVQSYVEHRRLTASAIYCQYFRTHHPAAVHSPLRALPSLRLRLRRFTDGENAPC